MILKRGLRNREQVQENIFEQLLRFLMLKLILDIIFGKIFLVKKKIRMHQQILI
jgi:hypothetical protein